MTAPRRHYVLNLPEWDLPRLEDLEWKLIERLTEAARVRRLRAESLEDVFHDVLHDSLVELVEAAVNETLEYWLKGLGDGNDGPWPSSAWSSPISSTARSLNPSRCSTVSTMATVRASN